MTIVICDADCIHSRNGKCDERDIDLTAMGFGLDIHGTGAFLTCEKYEEKPDDQKRRQLDV